MKAHSLSCGALLMALMALPASGQLILKQNGVQVASLTPNGTTLLSSNDNPSTPAPNDYNNQLKVTLDFSFNYSLQQMTLAITNSGNPSNAGDTYNISQFGFNAPGSWGTVGLTSITPNNGGIVSLTTMANLFGGYSFSTWVGTNNGGGNGDHAGELGIDQGESATLVFNFTTPSLATFNLGGLLNGNGNLADLGLRIQPMSVNGSTVGSDKWVTFYTYTPPPDIPPPGAVPEPATYGMAGFAMLATLVGFRRLRLRK